MHVLRTVDLKGNAIHGAGVYITVVTAHSIGGGLDVEPDKVLLVDKPTANARVQAGFARHSTPEEIALFESERTRDAAALADARAEDDEASRLAAEQAIEAEVARRVADEVDKRVAERMEGLKHEITVRLDDEEVTRRVLEVLEDLGVDPAELEKVDKDPPGDLGAITNGDPAGTNRDPKPSGNRPQRGGRNT